MEASAGIVQDGLLTVVWPLATKWAWKANVACCPPDARDLVSRTSQAGKSNNQYCRGCFRFIWEWRVCSGPHPSSLINETRGPSGPSWTWTDVMAPTVRKVSIVAIAPTGNSHVRVRMQLQLSRIFIVVLIYLPSSFAYCVTLGES